MRVQTVEGCVACIDENVCGPGCIPTTAPSRRALLAAVVGVGISALVADLGARPAAAQVCVSLPCRQNPACCQAGGGGYCCCQLPFSTSAQCRYRAECENTGGTCLAPNLTVVPTLTPTPTL